MSSSLNDFKRAWKEFEVEDARRGFSIHLASYIIINCFLILLNIYTSYNELWFPWVILGWGIGLAFHYIFSREYFVISEVEKKIAIIEAKMNKRKK